MGVYVDTGCAFRWRSAIQKMGGLLPLVLAIVGLVRGVPGMGYKGNCTLVSSKLLSNHPPGRYFQAWGDLVPCWRCMLSAACD